MEESLKNLEEMQKKQLNYAKKQFRMSVIAAISCAMIMVFVGLTYFSLIPKLSSSLVSVNQTAQNLEKVTRQLSEADLAGMVGHVDKLAVTSEAGIQDALEKIDKIDIDELNAAIGTLSEAVEPLARLSSLFK